MSDLDADEKPSIEISHLEKCETNDWWSWLSRDFTFVCSSIFNVSILHTNDTEYELKSDPFLRKQTS